MKQKELTESDILRNIESELRRKNDFIERAIVVVVSAVVTSVTCNFLWWLFS